MSKRIKIICDDVEYNLEMADDKTILDLALENDIDAPYSCQGGVCSSCLGRVTIGNAIMTKNSILTDDEVDDGFILTCQAYPTTSKISIDFDDV